VSMTRFIHEFMALISINTNAKRLTWCCRPNVIIITLRHICRLLWTYHTSTIWQ